MKDLSETLDKLINNEGGRLKLASIIMSECREFFTYKERIAIDKLILKEELKDYRLKTKTPSPYMWASEDVKFLMEHKANMSNAKLSVKLKRTKSAIRQKYKKMLKAYELFNAA